MTKKIIYGMVFALLLTLSFASAEVYDDFSGSSLDTSLWTESVDSTASGNLDEYGLDTTNENYHTAQLTAADRGRLLLLTKSFENGDVLQYNVSLEKSSGNILSRLYIGGTYLDLIIGTSLSYPEYATTGDIGYWNGDSEVGNGIGTYEVIVNFNSDSADFEITNPSGIVWNYTATGLTAPYTFGVATRTGHNGIGEINYDNFEVGSASASISTTTIEAVNTTELQERVDVLEATVVDLQDQIDTLQSEIDALESTSSDHETRITSLETLTSWLLKKVTKLLKK